MPPSKCADAFSTPKVGRSREPDSMLASRSSTSVWKGSSDQCLIRSGRSVGPMDGFI